MGEQIGFGEALSASIFVGMRLLFGIVIFAAFGLVIYQAIVFFVGVKARDLGKRRYRWAVASLGAVLVLFLLREPTSPLLTSLGMSLTRMFHIRDESWGSLGLLGLYNTLTATAVLLLLIQIVGAAYWFFEKLLESWQKRLALSTPEGQSWLVAHIAKAVRVLNRGVRSAAIVTLLLVFYPLTLRFFPATGVFVDAVGAQLAPSAREISQAILGYLPNLVYLLIILPSWMGVPEVHQVHRRCLGDRVSRHRWIRAGVGLTDLQVGPVPFSHLPLDGQLPLLAGRHLPILSRLFGLHRRFGDVRFFGRHR